MCILIISQGNTSSFAVIGRSTGRFSNFAWLRQVNTKLQTDIDNLKAELKEKSDTFQSMKLEHEDAREMWEWEKTLLTDECIGLEYKLKGQQIDLIKYKELVCKLEQRVRTLEDRLIEYDRNSAALDDENLLEELEMKISDVILQVDSFKHILEKMVHDAKDNKALAEVIKQTVDDLKDLAIAAEKQRTETNTELQRLRFQIDTVSKENSDIKSKVKKVSKENGEIKSRLAAVSQENSEIKSEISCILEVVQTMNTNVAKMMQQGEKSKFANTAQRKCENRWINQFSKTKKWIRTARYHRRCQNSY